MLMISCYCPAPPRTRTCWTPGSAPGCSPSPCSAGPRAPPTWTSSTPPGVWGLPFVMILRSERGWQRAREAGEGGGRGRSVNVLQSAPINVTRTRVSPSRGGGGSSGSAHHPFTGPDQNGTVSPLHGPLLARSTGTSPLDTCVCSQKPKRSVSAWLVTWEEGCLGGRLCQRHFATGGLTESSAHQRIIVALYNTHARITTDTQACKQRTNKRYPHPRISFTRRGRE